MANNNITNFGKRHSFDHFAAKWIVANCLSYKDSFLTLYFKIMNMRINNNVKFRTLRMNQNFSKSTSIVGVQKIYGPLHLINFLPHSQSS